MKILHNNFFKIHIDSLFKTIHRSVLRLNLSSKSITDKKLTNLTQTDFTLKIFKLNFPKTFVGDQILHFYSVKSIICWLNLLDFSYFIIFTIHLSFLIETFVGDQILHFYSVKSIICWLNLLDFSYFIIFTIHLSFLIVICRSFMFGVSIFLKYVFWLKSCFNEYMFPFRF